MLSKSKKINVCEITERYVNNVRYPIEGLDRPNEVWLGPNTNADITSKSKILVTMKRPMTVKQYEKFLKFWKESGIDKTNRQKMKGVYIE